jgi:hypothetical protein
MDFVFKVVQKVMNDWANEIKPKSKQKLVKDIWY